MTTALFNSGPFYMRRLPYRLGFRWFEQVRCTKHVPGRTGYSEWETLRYRLYWHGVPVGRWRPGTPTFRLHRRHKP